MTSSPTKPSDAYQGKIRLRCDGQKGHWEIIVLAVSLLVWATTARRDLAPQFMCAPYPDI